MHVWQVKHTLNIVLNHSISNKRIGDHMSDIRLFLEGQNTVVKLPALLKYNRGNSLMSWEEIDVPIFTKQFSYWVEMTVSGGWGSKFRHKK